jgi:4-hydroxy-4-methyl-2-oxoglutarate aldolase
MEKVETATVGHFLHSGFLDRELRAVLPEKRIAGTAVTVRLPHADSTILHYLTKAGAAGRFHRRRPLRR